MSQEVICSFQGPTSSFQVVGNQNATNTLNINQSAALHSGLTNIWGGGATSFVFTVPGITPLSIPIAQIFTSSNVVSITGSKCLANNQLTVLFSADPGVGTQCNYHYTQTAQ